MTVALNSDRLGARTFSFGVVRDTTFTPLLAYLAVANVLTAYERATGPASFTIRGTASIRGARRAGLRGHLHRRPAGGHRRGLHRGPAHAAVQEHVRAHRRGAHRAHHRCLGRAAPRRGSNACGSTPRGRAPAARRTVSVALRGPKGEEILKQVPITFPPTSPGRSSCWSPTAPARGPTTDARCGEPRSSVRRRSSARSTASRRSNRLYVRLSTSEPGAVVSGEPMSGLPPSVLGVLESDRSTGSVATMRSALRGEWEVASTCRDRLAAADALPRSTLMTRTHATRGLAAGLALSCVLTALSPPRLLAGGHAGRLPPRRRGPALHRRARAACARARGAARLRRRGVGGLDDGRAARWHGVLGTGNDGKVFKVEPTARARCSTTAPNSRCTPWRLPRMAGSMSAPHPMAVSTEWTPGSGHAVLRSRRQVHLGAGHDAKGVLYAATGDKGNVYRIGPDGKGELFFATKATMP
jgi:hypothetical protein